MIASMILIMIVEPLFLLALVLGILKARSGLRVACGIIAAVSLVSLYLGVPGLAVQGIVTIVGILCFVWVRAKSRIISAILFGPLIAFYALGVVAETATEAIDLSFAQSLVKRISALREEYPLKSMADRLAYEAKMNGRGVDVEYGARVHQLNPEVEQRLTSIEQQFIETDPYSPHRRTALASLHTRTNEEFVEASGFGRRRIIDRGAVYAEWIELPELEPIPVQSDPGPSYDPEHESAIPMADTAVAAKLVPAKDELLSMHDSGIEDFVDPDRIGFVRDRDHVAGFQSHRFTKIPEPAASQAQSHEQWKIVRLELVSLLKHDTPIAYVSQHLPQMDELRDAPTRPLDEFERISLDRLRSDEDVMIDETPDRIRMIGSLRAARNCLDCHAVRRGELLGALTYELVPVRPAQKKLPQVSPPSS